MSTITSYFEYERSLGDCSFYRNNKGAICKGVTFAISRYRQHSHTITFDELCSVNDAIMVAEEYLSYPLTEDYYNKIKDDLFMNKWTWEQAQKEYKNRGECLSGCKFLESVELDDNGILSLFCGS